MTTDRRGFLLTAGAVAAGAALAPRLPSPALAQQAGPPQTGFLNNNPRWTVKPFPLHRVSLAGGTVFASKRDRVLNYAAAYPADRVLHNFRVTAGLPTPPGSAPPGGWDDANGNLRGHFSGHLLTLFAQAYAATGQAQYKNKLDFIVSVLGDCQQAMAGRFSHPGFLAAYPETQFIQLEQLATYPTIWAPYYTCHKIMRGLLDSYLLTGNQEALSIVTAMGDWVHSRLSRLTRQRLNQMWAIYIAGEFGAMNEQASTLTVTGQGNLALNLRVPAWARNFQVRVNGVLQSGATPGSFLRLTRTWQTGDTIQVSMPFPLRVEKARDNPTIQSVFHGPVLLPAISSQTSLRNVSLYRSLGLDGDLARAFQPAGPPSTFSSNGFTFRPLYVGDVQPHHPYVRRNEPTVVFGSQNSGVPNRTQSDGQTFLDVVWSQAPFANRTAFVQSVTNIATDWRNRGLLSSGERTAIIQAAQNANLT